MKQKRTKDILIYLSQKYNRPVWVIKELVESQFDFLWRVIESADKYTLDMKSVRLFKLGLFYVSPGRLKFYTRCNEKREKSNTECRKSNGDMGNDTETKSNTTYNT